MATWIITRERDEGEPLVQELLSRGVCARALPCIKREALDWPVDLAPAADGVTTIVICTSPFAARLIVSRWPTLRATAGAALLTCAATAPATARVLEAADVPVWIRASGGVVALARAVAAAIGPEPRPMVLYPTSDRGDESDEHAEALAILAPHADVVGGVIYSTLADDALDGAVRDLEPDAALVFFSPSAVTAFVSSATRAAAAMPHTVVCLGGSTARAFERAAHRAPILAPREVDLVDFVRSLPETPP